MADLFQYLAALDSDPDDAAALRGLAGEIPRLIADQSAITALGETRQAMRDRGRLELVSQLFDIEIGAGLAPARQADLLNQKGLFCEEELLDEAAAAECFRRVLALRPGDPAALEMLQQIEEERSHWQRFAAKFVDEAASSTDRQLTAHLHLTAAETWARHQPGSPEAEQHLKKALEVDPTSRRASLHLERLLRRQERWQDLADLLEGHADRATQREDRIATLLRLADLWRGPLQRPERAIEPVKKVIALDAAQPQALRLLGDAYERSENWAGLVGLYTSALKSRRLDPQEELAMLVQAAMVLWKRVGDLDAAEEHFRRVRKTDPAHPAALDFYRVYLPPRNETGKLVQMLRQVESQLPPPGQNPAADARRRVLAVEIAELSEAQLANPEKAIEAWKQMLRVDSSSHEAREGLRRLYRRTEKWNALLDLYKEDMERLPPSDLRGRVDRLLEVVEIYRDKLKLEVMVINTYVAILKLEPGNRQAIDALSDKYRELGRWNDLIAILNQKADLVEMPSPERAALLREIADLWSDRFGNFAQAVKPLERLLELEPGAADTIARLKQIYTHRKQWRALIGLLEREASSLTATERQHKLSEMARIAFERVGDNRLAIELYNQVLHEFPDAPQATLAALAHLYEREKRWLALAEVLRQQRQRATGAEAVALLEKLGALWSDRLGAPALAADVMSEVLAIDPHHVKALRSLRELYAAAGDYERLEQLYLRLGQHEELVDGLLAIADRIDDRSARLPLLERAARIAQGRVSDGGRGEAAERAARVWERILAVQGGHPAAASALAPFYAKTEKWSRLLPVLEVLLAQTSDPAERLRRTLEIRNLCETKLNSKALAFTWTLRAVEQSPNDEALLADLSRLAQEPEQWREVIAALERLAGSDATAESLRVRFLRELSRISMVRLHDLERARGYQRRILERDPDDAQAAAALEELAIQLSDWPGVLALYHRRVEREKSAAARIELLYKVAFIEEERLADLDAAAATYHRILELDAKSARALRALSRIQEARGDWDGLDEVLIAELAAATDPDVRFDILMRLGSLEEKSLDRPDAAVRRYLEALAVPGPGGTLRTAAVEAAVRYLDGDGAAKRIARERRLEIAGVLQPHFEKTRDTARTARALEVLREAASGGDALAIDRRLLGLYGGELADSTKAWEVGVRVLAAEPLNRAVRGQLQRLSVEPGRAPAYAEALQAALVAARGTGAPTEVRALASELAQHVEGKLSDAAAAEPAWRTVLELEPAANDAFDALSRLYRGASRWMELRDLLRRRVEATTGAPRATALAQLAELEGDVLGDQEQAIATHRRILDSDPTATSSYDALERLLAGAERWRDLESLLAARRGQVGEIQRLRIDLRRAELRLRSLGDVAGAVDLLETIVHEHRTHADARELLEEILPRPELRLRVARILEPLYAADKLWKDLVLVLRAQLEFAAGPTDSIAQLSRIAAIEETELGNPQGAFETWLAALAIDPTDEVPRRALLRLAGALGRWAGAAAAWEKAVAAVPVADAVTRTELLTELGQIYDLHLNDSGNATLAYGRLLDADPANPTTVRRAAAALARLHEDGQRWPELRAVVRRQADWAENPDERRRLLGRVAVLDEERLQDPGAAIATWREIVAEDVDDADALDALERLFQGSGRWSELVEVLRKRVERGGGPLEQKALLRRIAEIHETRLSQPTEAITTHLEVFDHIPEDNQTLVDLARLYRAAGRHADLVEILERRLAAALSARRPGPELVELEAEIAGLIGGPLGRERDALERWASVLSRDPGHSRAVAEVEQAMDDVDLRLRAGTILRPLYASTGQADKLAALLVRIAELTDEPRERMVLFNEVARLRERQLGDREGALAAGLRALDAAVAEPELGALVAEVERLATELGREGDLIDIYRRIAPEILDGNLQRRLLLDVADLARAVRGDVALARDHYQKVLDAKPDDPRALNALESIHREAGENDRLYQILTRKAELAGDVDEQVHLLSEAATLCAGPLKRFEDAIAAWQRVIEIAPENQAAVAALEQLFRGGKRWHELADLYERRLGFAVTVDEAVALRVRLGELYGNELNDPASAVESFAAALGGDPNNRVVRAALERALEDPAVRSDAAEVLEPIYVANQDWPKLIRIYEIKLEAATDPKERLNLTRYMARLYEEQLEDLEGAMRWYARVFEEDPANHAVRDQLHRLVSILENWPFLASVYQKYLDDTSEDSLAVREIAVLTASLYDRRLNDVERGQLAYRRALRIDGDGAAPSSDELFQRLEALLTRADRWGTLIEVYEEAIEAAGPRVERKLDLFARMARTYEQRLVDPIKAIAAWREVQTLATANNAAWEASADELDQLFRLQGQWYELAELLTTRVDRAATLAQAVSYRLGLAELLETKLNDTLAALEQYQTVLQGQVGWERALPALERLVLVDDYRERIADLLEPVYRRSDWWQKLVVILDAQLAYIDSPQRQVEVLREIAQLHEKRGGSLPMAMRALSRAWKLDVGELEIFEQLCAQAHKLGAWDELIAVLESGLATNPDPEVAATVLAKVAEVQEVQRVDPAAAIAAWRRYLEYRADDAGALAALDRLYAAENRSEDLVAVVERRADLAEDARVRLVLLHRAATLYETALNRPNEAIATYKNVLGVDETDAAALDALERLYRKVSDWSELAGTLLRKIELAASRTERTRLRLTVAAVFERELKDVYEAITQLGHILAEDPNHAETLAELDRLYLQEKMWADLLEILDRRAKLAASIPERADLQFRAAKVLDRELAEPEQAIPRYFGVLQLVSSHTGARMALEVLLARDELLEATAVVLEAIYRAEHNVEALVRLYERRLGVPAGDAKQRRAHWKALADLHEVMRNSPEGAFRTWARALIESPESVELFRQLERIAAARGTWQQLASFLEDRLAARLDAELEYVYAMKLAGIYEEAMADMGRAAASLERAARVASDEKQALIALERVYLRSRNWEELSKVLVRLADAAPDDASAAEFLFRRGDLHENTIGDLRGAVRAYRDVLARAPRHTGARSALERLLARAEEHRAEIIDILEPLYESEMEWRRLADLLTSKLAVTVNPTERAAIYHRVAELAESRLRDPVRALDAVGGWLAEDPTSADALREIDRLAAVVGRWSEVAARLSGIVAAVDRRDARMALLTNLGQIQLHRLGDLVSAAATYRGILELEPESLLAFDALAQIHRETGDLQALALVQAKRGALLFDPADKRAAWAETALLRERLGNVDGTISAWKAVLDVEETDREALGHLARIYERQSNWTALVEILTEQARVAASPEEEKAVRVRIAQISGDVLGNLGDAAQAWQAVLDLDPRDAGALGALENVYARNQDWLAVEEVVRRRIDMVRTTAEKVALLGRLARIAEERRDSPDDAISQWHAALELDSSHLLAYSELERLLARTGRWHDLVELLEKLAELHGTLGAAPAEVQALARAADVLEDKLENPDAAAELLERVLRRDPNSVAALTRLAKIYEGAGDWERCGQILQRALGLSPKGRDAADLFFRLGEVANKASGDLETAVSHWRQALSHDPTHLPAVVALEKIAREREDLPWLSELLTKREAATTDAPTKLAIAIELAEVLRRLGRAEAAIPLLARAASLAPDDIRVLAPLADLYVAARRYADAAPIYDRLAEEAKAGRRMKDVARYRQRQGGLLENRGDTAGALAAYEEAFRINPTDVSTMAGLGRIYMDQKDWEKARRVYRSLVLQNIEADAGVSKADVYLALGIIHVELGEGPKAKGMFQRGLEIEPGHPALKDALARLG